MTVIFARQQPTRETRLNRPLSLGWTDLRAVREWPPVSIGTFSRWNQYSGVLTFFPSEFLLSLSEREPMPPSISNSTESLSPPFIAAATMRDF
jgi:hypothetical protein